MLPKIIDKQWKKIVDSYVKTTNPKETNPTYIIVEIPSIESHRIAKLKKTGRPI